MNIETIRHSLSHILAYAIQELYPKAKFGMGPAIENGFYYDFDKLKDSDLDLPKIESKMREIIKNGVKFKKEILSKHLAKKLFQQQPFKLEIIEEIPEKNVSVYKSGKFADLCKGPHVNSDKDFGTTAFKLKTTAGAYWKGNEKNKMLTRIYGTAFESKKELNEYIRLQEEMEKRDHRKLGKELDLFVFSDMVGKGLPMLTAKGTVIRRLLERFVIEEEIKRGYDHVITPPLAKTELYKTSGHYPYYKDTMYPIMKVDEDELILRPMTCPHHFMLYKSKPHSYRELPMRIAEIASQFRYEKSGELSGLTRTRMFCLADAHIICAKEQAKQEIKNALELIDYMNDKFGLKKGKDYRYRLSLGDRKDKKKYYKNDKAWDNAENVLRSVLKEINAPFFEAENEAAFYGPKIDIQMKKINGQEETAFTVQYDFVMPQRFNLLYIDENNKEKQPIVIHRSSIGAFERTMAFLIEHYAGAFPFWLAPEQVWIIPIGSTHEKYALEIKNRLSSFRTVIKNKNESVSKKIREGEIQKIPYVLVIGDKEISDQTVSVRQRGKKEIETMVIEDFLRKEKN